MTPRRAALLLLLIAACQPAQDGPAAPSSAAPASTAPPVATATATAVAPGSSARATTPPPSSQGSAAAPAASVAPAAASSSATAGQLPEGMVRIPEGIFLMGAFAAVGNPEEHPAHEAIVAAFDLDKTEVTVGAYRQCVKAGGCQPAHTDHRFCDFEAEGKDGYPINCVDLRQATAFCQWAGKRLPTEREWEYAAGNGAERRRFSWGLAEPVPGKNACYDHPGGSCPVGSFAPGAFGLLDMTGNVWEWTSSRFKRYPSSPLGDPIEDGHVYVYKGGSWSRRFSKWMRVLMRNRYAPNKYSASIGMRCARTVQPLTCPPQTAPRDGVCARVEGDPQCEPRYSWDGERCRLGGAALRKVGMAGPAPGSGSRPPAPATAASSGAAAGSSVRPSASAAPGPIQVVRTRTPQHDADCRRHWPKTPVSYLFKGGPNFPSRKPILRAAGCVPRDMSWGWTSACCKQ